ncbi:GNAT family N-acetyltransferase [Halorubrum sp. BV1]|uniref:GNAT family N-acetyltransferase n=1 Tax=Halorubrum sp. BV1 TaxID=1498500 RepID=UPI000679B090|nr:GNAT family N-acetyltransferase [Halorubrum sp. BV1]
MSGERSPGGRPRDPPDGFAIEPAAPDDRLDVLRVLDAAMLETDAAALDDAVDRGDALVASFDRTDAVVGALVAVRRGPEQLHVDAVAVRRSRRGRGIGSALVATAVRRAERDPDIGVVTAEFDAELEEFYRDLGFEVVSAGDGEESGRLRGSRRVGDGSGG